MAKCIFLAGAPDAVTLSWDEDNLEDNFNSPVRRFLDGQAPTSSSNGATQASSLVLPKWRSLTINTGAHTTYEAGEKNQGEARSQTQFLSFASNESCQQDHFAFLTHSLARLNELESSQIAPAGEDTTLMSATDGTSLSTTSFSTESFSTDYGSFAALPGQTQDAAHHPRLTSPITNLRQIPNADHVTRIAPQTITINLLVAVISLSPTRTVRLRKRTGEMDILELLVGDDTRAGFSISFWLAPTDSQRRDSDDMRQHLTQLRAGDVVMVQNIALSAFKGCVYGQSLSKRFARNSTSLSVLWDTRGLPVGLKGKYERVVEWRDGFVGRTTGSTVSSKKDDGVVGDWLPADTQ